MKPILFSNISKSRQSTLPFALLISTLSPKDNYSIDTSYNSSHYSITYSFKAGNFRTYPADDPKWRYVYLNFGHLKTKATVAKIKAFANAGKLAYTSYYHQLAKDRTHVPHLYLKLKVKL